MTFEEKYTRESEKTENKNKDKKVISNDAYALGEMIENLINKLEHLRISV